MVSPLSLISKRAPVWMGRLSLVETAKATSSIMARRVRCWMETAKSSSTAGKTRSAADRPRMSKSASPRLELDHLALVGGEGDHVVGHPADDVAEEPGVEDQLALAGDVGGHLGADAGLQVVAGDDQLRVGPQQQALQGGNGALLRHGPAGDGDGALQQGLSQENFIIGTLLCTWDGGGQPRSSKEKDYFFRKSRGSQKRCGKGEKAIEIRGSAF